MRIRRPSPALVVAVVALVVACSGTALATSKYVVTSTKQVRNGAISGLDVRNHSLHGGDLADGTITSRQIRNGTIRAEDLRASARTGAGTATATEAFRKTGPERSQGGGAKVATLTLQPGAYAIFAKVNMAPSVRDQGLLDTLLKSNKTIDGRCTLDAAGDVDESAGALVSPGSQNPLELTVQITRTISKPGTVTLSCSADAAPWHASDASIIALPVDRATRERSTP